MEKHEFAKEILLMLERNCSPEEIGEWAFSYAMINGYGIDGDIYDLCIRLNTASLGDEFEISREDIEKAAKDLIDLK